MEPVSGDLDGFLPPDLSLIDELDGDDVPDSPPGPSASAVRSGSVGSSTLPTSPNPDSCGGPDTSAPRRNQALAIIPEAAIDATTSVKRSNTSSRYSATAMDPATRHAIRPSTPSTARRGTGRRQIPVRRRGGGTTPNRFGAHRRAAPRRIPAPDPHPVDRRSPRRGDAGTRRRRHQPGGTETVHPPGPEITAGIPHHPTPGSGALRCGRRDPLGRRR